MLAVDKLGFVRAGGIALSNTEVSRGHHAWPLKLWPEGHGPILWDSVSCLLFEIIPMGDGEVSTL